MHFWKVQHTLIYSIFVGFRELFLQGQERFLNVTLTLTGD